MMLINTMSVFVRETTFAPAYSTDLSAVVSKGVQ